MDRGLLWRVLRKQGWEEEEVQVLQRLYTSPATEIVLDAQHRVTIAMERGIRQGCALSPILWALYIDPMIRDLQRLQGWKYRVANALYQLGVLVFADDVLLQAENAQQLDTMFGVVQDWCGRLRLSVEPTKCKCVSPQVTTQSIRLGRQRRDRDGRMRKAAVPVAREAQRYLGVWVSAARGTRCSLAEVVQAKVLSRLDRIKDWGYISPGAKTRLLNATVGACVEYGLPAILATQKELEDLDKQIRKTWKHCLTKCNLNLQMVYLPEAQGGWGLKNVQATYMKHAVWSVLEVCNNVGIIRHPLTRIMIAELHVDQKKANPYVQRFWTACRKLKLNVEVKREAIAVAGTLDRWIAPRGGSFSTATEDSIVWWTGPESDPAAWEPVVEIISGELEVPTRCREVQNPVAPLEHTSWAQGLERVGTPQIVEVAGAPVEIDAPRWNFMLMQHRAAMERTVEEMMDAPRAEWQQVLQHQENHAPAAIRTAWRLRDDWNTAWKETQRKWGPLRTIVAESAQQYGIHSTEVQRRMRDHWAHHPGVYRMLRKHLPQLKAEYHASPWNATGVFPHYGAAYPEDMKLGALGTAQALLQKYHMSGTMNGMFDDTPKKPGQLHETVMLAKEAAQSHEAPITLILTIPYWGEENFEFQRELNRTESTVARKLWTFKKGQYCFRHGAAEAGWKEKYSHTQWDTDLWVVSNDWEHLDPVWEGLRADLRALQGYLASPTWVNIQEQTAWSHEACTTC